MKPLWIDIETRSHCNLTKHGSYRYGVDGTTDILIVCWAIGDAPISTWIALWEPMPAPLHTLFAKPKGHQWRAHNASFERNVLGPRYKALADPALWYCTKAQAQACALAGSLEHAAQMLDLEQRKSARGQQLIRLLSIPREDGTFNEDPALIREFAVYCKQDVAVMRAFSRSLPPLTDEALAVYHANERINDRGLPIDTELCEAAMKYADEAVAEAAGVIQYLTEGVVTTARSSKLKQWLYDRLPEYAREAMLVEAASENAKARYTLDADTRANLLEIIDADTDSFAPEVIAAIEAVEEAAMSSISKYQTMLDRVSADGRLRGAFVTNGAAQTGRFSSQGAQVHNFPRLVAENVEGLRFLILRKQNLGTSTLGALKSMLRPAIRPQRGFIVRADWNAVEARGLPWLAGFPARKYLDSWRDDSRDQYIEQAALAGLAHDARQEGKVVVLSLGFGGGPNALARMCRSYNVKIDNRDLVVARWRRANQWAPLWWRELILAAHLALRRGEGEWIVAQRVKLNHNGQDLLMKLPSGRMLHYPKAKFELQRDESVITYRKAAHKPKAAQVTGWPRAKLWHGTLAENATQATCGDLLRDTLRECDAHDVEVIGHVHDELIGEAENKRRAAELAREFQRRMMAIPPWAEGLPLKVATDIAPYFRK